MAELTKKQIEKAMSWKCCPFCQGQDFCATFEHAERNFWIEVRDGVVWEKRDKDIIETVKCNICGEEIPKEIWEKWGLEK